MTEQRTNAAGETVEYNKDTDRWEPVKNEAEAPKVEEDASEPEDEGKPVSFTYTPRNDK